MRCAEHEARMGQKTGSHMALVGKFEKRSHLADPIEEGKIGLK
jgi:hypothetical protein